MKWKNRFCRLFGVAAVVALLATPAFATSSRVTPEAGYAAHDYTIKTVHHEDQVETGIYEWYSGGLDTGYAELAEFNNPGNPNNDSLLARAFVHQNSFYDDNTGDSWMETNLYTHTGDYVTTLADLGAAWPQCVKIIGEKVWFSYTGGSGPGFYSVPWYPDDLSQYPAVPQLEITDIPFNWEIEERAADGEIFFCGLAGSSWGETTNDHSVYYLKQDPMDVVKIIEIGGYSSGCAFDSEGNLWSGEYLLSFDPEMHILPCRLGMWTKAAVDAVIAGGGSLDWNDAAVIINLGTRPGSELNWGPNDIEADPDGNIYVSLNTYDGWGENNEYGAVIQVYKDGEDYHTKYITDTDCTGNNNWDWHRGLAFDGNTDIDTGGYTDPTQFPAITGNRLYLDMDHNQNDPDSPDQVVGITIDDDYDADGVPDSLDNAPETANSGQQDTDGDMYGNIADADLNNDGTVSGLDYSAFRSAWGSSGSGLDADFNQDGTVGGQDYSILRNRWTDSAPYY